MQFAEAGCTNIGQSCLPNGDIFNSLIVCFLSFIIFFNRLFLIGFFSPFITSSVSEWNSLPIELKQSTNLNLFKSKLKQFI